MAIEITDEEILHRARDSNKKFDELDQDAQEDLIWDASIQLAAAHAKALQLRLNRKIWMRNRAKLCTILRDPALWPKKFKWDFRSPDNCGMGLARKSGFFEVLSDDALQKTFGLTAEDLKMVFVFPGKPFDLPWDKVVWWDAGPEDVAAALERVG